MGLCSGQESWRPWFRHHYLSNRHYQGRGLALGEVRVLSDQEASTLTVWFGNPNDEDTCEATGDGIVLMKDKDGEVIGFERLHYYLPPQEKLQVAVETV